MGRGGGKADSNKQAKGKERSSDNSSKETAKTGSGAKIGQQRAAIVNEAVAAACKRQPDWN